MRVSEKLWGGTVGDNCGGLTAAVEDSISLVSPLTRSPVPRIDLAIHVAAPPDRCFDLARSVEFHVRSTSSTREQAVAGVTHGLLGLGDSVTWRARHLGVTQELTSRITVFDRPRRFRDTQVQGAFRRFDHDHYFEPAPGGGTVLRDVFDFEAPLGLLGRFAEWLFLTAYMRRFLSERALEIKSTAESTDWTKYVRA